MVMDCVVLFWWFWGKMGKKGFEMGVIVFWWNWSVCGFFFLALVVAFFSS